MAFDRFTKVDSRLLPHSLRLRTSARLWVGVLLVFSSPGRAEEYAQWENIPEYARTQMSGCCRVPSVDVHFNLDFRCAAGAAAAPCLREAVANLQGPILRSRESFLRELAPNVRTLLEAEICDASAENLIPFSACVVDKLSGTGDARLVAAIQASGANPGHVLAGARRLNQQASNWSLLALACNRAQGLVTLTREGRRIITRRTGTPDTACLAQPAYPNVAFDPTPASLVAAAPGGTSSPSPSATGLGAASLRPSAPSGTDTPLFACVYGYNHGLSEAERNWSAPEVCRTISGTNVAQFDRELTLLMSRSSINTYFEMLRIEALSRFVRAHQDLVGSPLGAIPPACQPFREGIQATITSAAASPSGFGAAVPSPEFAQALSNQAKFLVRLRDEALGLKAIPSRDCEDTTVAGHPVCVPNPEYDRAQRELLRIREAFRESFRGFPILAAGQSPTVAEPWDGVPSLQTFANTPPGSPAFQAAITSARGSLSQGIRDSIARFCGDTPPDGASWQDLVGLPELTESVLRRFPHFRAVQECSEEYAHRDQATRQFASQLMLGGCLMGTIVTEGAVAPLCAAIGVGRSYVEFSEAQQRLFWTARCQSAGQGAVCNESNYRAARTEYDEAVFMLGVSVVGAAIDLPIAARQLRTVANFLRPSELRGLATRLAAARAIEDPAIARAALQQIEEEASVAASARGLARPHLEESYNWTRVPAADRAAIQRQIQALEAAGASRARILEVIPCLR